MKKLYLQLWEQTHKSEKIIPSGASLHINEENRKEFIEKIYKNRRRRKPKAYERIVGDASITYVSDQLFKKIEESKSKKISQIELDNLIFLNEIKI